MYTCECARTPAHMHTHQQHTTFLHICTPAGFLCSTAKSQVEGSHSYFSLFPACEWSEPGRNKRVCCVQKKDEIKNKCNFFCHVSPTSHLHHVSMGLNTAYTHQPLYWGHFAFSRHLIKWLKVFFHGWRCCVFRVTVALQPVCPFYPLTPDIKKDIFPNTTAARWIFLFFPPDSLAVKISLMYSDQPSSNHVHYTQSPFQPFYSPILMLILNFSKTSSARLHG